jgi:hypothetical protein
MTRNLPAGTSTAALASTAASRAPTTAAFARNHRTGFIDHQGAAHQVATIAGFYGPVGGGIVVDLNEPESASHAGETIAHHVHAIDGDTRLRKEIR